MLPYNHMTNLKLEKNCCTIFLCTRKQNICELYTISHINSKQYFQFNPTVLQQVSLNCIVQHPTGFQWGLRDVRQFNKRRIIRLFIPDLYSHISNGDPSIPALPGPPPLISYTHEHIFTAVALWCVPVLFTCRNQLTKFKRNTDHSIMYVHPSTHAHTCK